MARGEAQREAPVPVPGESVCDGSRIPSRGPLVCRMEISPFCLTSLLSTLLIVKVILCSSVEVIVHVYKYCCDSTL